MNENEGNEGNVQPGKILNLCLHSLFASKEIHFCKSQYNEMKLEKKSSAEKSKRREKRERNQNFNAAKDCSFSQKLKGSLRDKGD